MDFRGRCLLGFSALLLGIGISQAKEPKPNKDVEVAVEVKFVSLDNSVVDQLKQNGLLHMESKEKDVLWLDNNQMIRFMALIQGDIHTNVMQAPRLTMLNGHRSEIDIVDEQHFVTGMEIAYRDGHIEYRPKNETVSLGWRMALRSIVSADRRCVRIHLDANANNLDSSDVPCFPITTPAPDGKAGTVQHYIQQPRITKVRVNRTVVLPDGNTAVLTTGLKQNRVERCEYGTPVLSDLPYIGRLFRNIGYGSRTSQLLVLVTPHILAAQEAEKKPAIKAASDHQTSLPL